MKTVRYVTGAATTTSRLEPPGWMDIDQQVIGIATKMANFIEPNPNESFWKKAGIFVAFVGMIIGVLICFTRGDFIDVTLNKLNYTVLKYKLLL